MYSEVQPNKKMLAPKAANLPLRTHTNAPTTIPDLQSAPVVFASPEQVSEMKKSKSTLSANNNNEPLPYPFLQGFVDRGMGGRFSKRVTFDRSDYDDLLGKIIEQIHEKKDRELIEKIKEREDE